MVKDSPLREQVARMIHKAGCGCSEVTEANRRLANEILRVVREHDERAQKLNGRVSA